MPVSYLPVVLLFAILGTFGVAFQAMKVCIERKDTLLGLIRAESPPPKDQVRLIFRADWVMLWLGTCLF